MDSIALIVLFDEPYWVGVFERRTGSSLQAAKTVFGAEPTDAEVHDVLLNSWTALSFSSAVEAPQKTTAASPKRRQREAARQTAQEASARRRSRRSPSSVKRARSSERQSVESGEMKKQSGNSA